MPLDYRITQRLSILSKELRDSAAALREAITQLGDAAVEAETLGETDLTLYSTIDLMLLGQVKELDDLARRLIRNQIQAHQHHEAFDAAKDSASISHTVEGISEKYQHGCKARARALRAVPQAQRYMDDPNYLDFRQRIWEVKHPDEEMPIPGQEANGAREDDEVIIETARTSLHCPLTAQYFENPVMNPSCRHNYSKTAVESYVNGLIRQRRSAPCPIPGCQALLSINVLQPNPPLGRMVMRAKQREEEEAASQYPSQAIREVD
ncbi:zinc-finger of the MIZ type in Nse subunit-domain-containing protein [Piptocephalis cylindrospora]|uniref:Zinc-finger of the MIZ type in Nse subunit-domain-containing protein n=1 Tax=Piptocephalis cylindrospora TaxID=1907219 RepID=A0A4P9Y286_9FUNG|nr:zinc-finger of the MIZ type in Nse subunit-domain-containing protein [Piptocephalis cylindrospora]|eukprot:RKP12873.1 zinc-finger of the MIZ type in Nse subunit-domain-containing protein [Piptocephalis cylindrospora]